MLRSVRVQPPFSLKAEQFSYPASCGKFTTSVPESKHGLDEQSDPNTFCAGGGGGVLVLVS